MGRPVRRIFLECTHTYYNGKNTGIQRVVRNLARWCQEVGRKENIECRPVVWSLWGFIGIDKIPENGRPAFHVIKGASQGAYRAAAGEEDAQPAAPGGVETAARPSFKRRIVVFLRRFAYALATLFSHWPTAVLSRRVALGDGDVLVLADASWSPPIWRAVNRARRRGCRVGVLFYDIIAVTNPEWFDRPLAASFQDWFGRAARECDCYIGISEATRITVQEQIDRIYSADGRTASSAPPGASFRLGVDEQFGTPLAGQSSKVRPEFEAFFDGKKICLAVATLEPRKNHEWLLDAFDLILQQESNAGAASDTPLALVLIGRVGWRCRAVLDRIHKHPQFGRRLMLWTDANDAELDLAYRRAHVLAAVSLAEGFGLPIIEGLARGVPVVASAIPVFFEVGGNHCRYVKLGATAELATAIQNAANGDQASPNQVTKFLWPDWHESCEELLLKIRALPEKIRG